MARRARAIVNESTQENPVNIGDTPVEASPKITEIGGSVSPRLSIPLTKEGFFDLGTMQPKTREKLTKALTDPALGTAFTAAPTVGSGDQFPPEITNVLYDAVSALMIAMARRAGYSSEAAAVLLFSAQEKDALSAPTARVLNKHLGGAFGKYQDEVMLCMAISAMITGKVGQLRKPATVHPFPNTEPAPPVKGENVN